MYMYIYIYIYGFPDSSVGKVSTCNALVDIPSANLELSFKLEVDQSHLIT